MKQYNYSELENKFNIVYPESVGATYTSLLNYSDDLNKPFQRWYRYKEGFSIKLVECLISEYAQNKKGIILDPFSGSGSTLIAAEHMGYSGIGFEVNPFSHFLAQTKLDTYTEKQIEEFKRVYKIILEKAAHYECTYLMPKLSISYKVFNKEVEKYFMSVGCLIESNLITDIKVKNLLKLGWLACIEPLSNYRKAGNGLKIKKYVKPRIITYIDAKDMLTCEYDNMYDDLLKNRKNKESIIYNETCFNMKKYLKEESVEGIIFSPPYANCFDYSEIYKLELWFGNFVSEYSELKNLRNNSIHSHLNGDLNINEKINSNIVENLLTELDKREIWDKKIPKMLQLYYNDMFKVINNCYSVLNNKGFCCIVVGNSSYGGIVFPTDLILAEYAASIGFTIDKIEVDRYIITSSQQYEMTKDNGKYLRESVICLVKNK